MRWPTRATAPPTWPSVSTCRSVPPLAAGVSVTEDTPLANPRLPEPSMAIRYELGGCSSDSATVAVKFPLMGPTRTVALAR